MPGCRRENWEMHTQYLAAFGLAAFALVSTSCTKPEEQVPIDKVSAQALFGSDPLTDKVDNPGTPEKVALGKLLYHDKSLSKGGDIACASCHDLGTFGVDNQPTSPGTGGTLGGRNTPSSLNASRHFVQFWDGRAKNVEEQATGPVLNPKEHGVKDEAELVALLARNPATVAAFQKAYPGDTSPVTVKNFQLAIGAFERTLATRSRFDDFVEGKDAALTTAEKKGLKTFMEVGCTACHMTRLVGGSQFRKLGEVVPFESKDLGRYEVTKQDVDRMMFKVPSLLNVAKTAPYFHDGSVATLDQAIKLMGKHQLGKNLADDQVAAIATFLGSLTGK